PMVTPTLMWLPAGYRAAAKSSGRSRNSRISGVRSRVATTLAVVHVSTNRMKPSSLVGRGPDQCQGRQQIEMGPVAQRQPQIARRKPRMFAHDRFRAAALAVLDRVDHDAVLVLSDQKNLLRFRQRRLRHHESAGGSEWPR